MRPDVDRDKCIVTGTCEVVAPGVFVLDDDGDVQLLVEEVEGELLEQAQEAARSCPARALSVHA